MLKAPKIILFIVLGIVFWFSGAMIVRILGADVFSIGNPALIILFIIAIPLGFAFLLIASVVSRVPIRNMFEPMVIMTFTALLMDGTAITWFHQLYGETTTHVLLGAGLILWGGGIGLIIGWVFSKQVTPAKITG